MQVFQIAQVAKNHNSVNESEYEDWHESCDIEIYCREDWCGSKAQFGIQFVDRCDIARAAVDRVSETIVGKIMILATTPVQ